MTRSEAIRAALVEAASRRRSARIDIDGTATPVLVEQVGAGDVGRLGDLAGHLTPEEQWGIDPALLTLLGLN